MPRTARPDVEELRESDELVNGDTGAAQDEIVARLREMLPDAIIDKNSRKSWAGNKAIAPVKVKEIELAPAELSDDHIGAILVDFEVTTDSEGLSGVFRNSVMVRVFCVDGRIVGKQQVRQSWAKAESIRECLYPFLDGCTDDNDQRVWKSLVPTGISIDKGDRFKNYSCTVATFKMIQSPSMNPLP